MDATWWPDHTLSVKNILLQTSIYIISTNILFLVLFSDILAVISDLLMLMLCFFTLLWPSYFANNKKFMDNYNFIKYLLIIRKLLWVKTSTWICTIVHYTFSTWICVIYPVLCLQQMCISLMSHLHVRIVWIWSYNIISLCSFPNVYYQYYAFSFYSFYVSNIGIETF